VHVVQINMTCLKLLLCLTLYVAAIRGQDVLDVECDFNTNFCGWTNSPSADFNWEIKSGPSPEINAGPNGDHSGDGSYAWSVGSGKEPLSYSRLVSPIYDAGNDNECLLFWYSMHGPDVQSFDINVVEKGTGKRTTVWSMMGDQGSGWKKTYLTIPPAAFPIKLDQIELVGIRGTDDSSGIGIDDIILKGNGSCDGQSGRKSSESCAMEEEGACGFRQDTTDDFDWVFQSGHSSQIGPRTDVTYNTAYGTYAFAGGPPMEVAGSEGRLISRVYQASDKGTDGCIKFWYRIHGKDSRAGSLQVFVRRSGDSGRGNQLWATQTTRGDEWHPATIIVPASLMGVDSETVFQAKSSGLGGEISIDEFRLTSGCGNDDGCTFEPDYHGVVQCPWRNTASLVQNAKWISGSGPTTASGKTGPTVDHTTGTTEGGYMYVSSSYSQKGDKAALGSEFMYKPFDGHCVKFWYHMYGDGQGTLNVWTHEESLTNPNGEYKKVWSISGNQGNKWNEGRIQISNEQYHRVIIEAEMGVSGSSDVAVDDISFVTSGCETLPPQADKFSADNSAGSIVPSLIATIISFMISKMLF